MIEIIGFWTVVTILTAIAISPVLTIAYFVIPYMASQVTEDKETITTLRNWVVDYHYSPEAGCIKPADYYGREKKGYIIFNKLVVSKTIWEAFTLFCLISAPIFFYTISLSALIAERTRNPDLTLLDCIIYPATITAPYAAWLTIIALTYFVLLKGIRKAYKMYKKVSKLLETKEQS